MMPNRLPYRLPPATAATLATIYEATAPKVGNVHPGARFDDLRYDDFVVAAVATGPILGEARCDTVGQTILEAVRATRTAVATNTNLGTLLLIAPLAAVPTDTRLERGIDFVLERLTSDDTRAVYEAIRLAAPGALGSVEVGDLYDEPPSLSLVEVMRLAADRDLVARQYTNQFEDVLRLATWIAEATPKWRLRDAIVHSHLRQLAAEPDSLIARKLGLAVANEASRRAAEVLATGRPGETIFDGALASFDTWLRGDAHRRNPGTSADLIAAALFVLLREGELNWDAW